MILHDGLALQVVLAGAVTTNQLPIVVYYEDERGDDRVTLTTTNSTTAVSVLTGTVSGSNINGSKVKRIRWLSIYNKDTASAIVTVKLVSDSTSYEVRKIALGAGESIEYVEGTGWVASTVATSSSGGGSTSVQCDFVVAISDETTALTTGTAKITFRASRAMTLTKIKASLSTAASSGVTTFDVNKNGVSVFSTLLTIDASEKTSESAATAAVLSTTAIGADDEITVDIDAVGTGAKGAKITFVGTFT